MMISKIFHLIFLLFALIVLGCDNQKNVEAVLVGDGMRFWDVYDYERGFFTGSYSFNANGSCFYYTYKKGVRAKIFDDDLVYPHTWKLKGDTILNMLGFDRRIVRYNSDTLFLQNLKTNEKIVFIRGKY